MKELTKLITAIAWRERDRIRNDETNVSSSWNVSGGEPFWGACSIADHADSIYESVVKDVHGSGAICPE
jgi:hypothetical protein